MGHAAVLVRGPASVPRDVRRDHPEHSLPLDTERATSRDARQEKHAVARRNDAAERAHHAGDRRTVPPSAVTVRGLVLEWLDAEGLDAPSLPELGPATSAWHAHELREARQVLEGAPQPCSARGSSSSSCAGSWTSTQSAQTAS